MINISELLDALSNKQIGFEDVLSFIDQHYYYMPSSFKNGEIQNTAEQNQGSARIFYFAYLNNLSQEDTLLLFAEHYETVINNPNGNNHQNIRQFLQTGWEKVSFSHPVLCPL